MEPAPELVAFAERMLASVATLDSDSYLDGFSRHPGVRFIGPDPDEWIEGFEQIAAVGKVQFHEMKETRWSPSRH